MKATKKTLGAAFALLLIIGVTGCVEKTRELTASQREQLSTFVSREAPSPAHALDISFEDKIKLVGYDVTADSWSPGATITVTWYWKAERTLEEGWQLFTHIGDADGRDRMNEDQIGVVRQLYPPGRWRSGEYIRDVQETTLPEDWDSSRAVFRLGIWNGPHRLQVTRGPNDGENRAIVLTIPTNAAGSPAAAAARQEAPSVPAIRALKTSTSITLDGQLNESAWRSAPATQAFVNTMTGAPAEFRATARTLWNDEGFYVGFEVADDFLKSEFRNLDDHLWEADCVEIMVDPGGRGVNYFEMQVSPNNVVFDTRYDRRRVPQPIGHADWNSGLRSQVTRRGTVNDDEEDNGYTVEILIPWTAFNHGDPPATKPNHGDTWRVNFYVMDSRDQGQRAAGWSPPRVGDFHMPNRFGRVQFIDPAAPSAAAPRPVQPRVLPKLTNRIREQLRGNTERNRAAAVRAEMLHQPQAGEEVLGAPSAMNPSAMTPSAMNP